jgi:hypothetical protein
MGLVAGLNTYLYVGGAPLIAVDPSGLIKCVYNPETFDTTGCTRISKKDKDVSVTTWGKDADVLLSTYIIPLPQFGFGLGLPNRNLAPVVPSAGKTENYAEIQVGFFDVQRLYRRYDLEIEEEWACPGGTVCVKKRTISCTGTWEPTDLIQRGGFGFRFFQKTLK